MATIRALLRPHFILDGTLAVLEDLVIAYLCYNVELGLRPNSFRKKLAGITHEHVLNRLPPPFRKMDLLIKYVTSYKRMFGPECSKIIFVAEMLCTLVKLIHRTERNLRDM